MTTNKGGLSPTGYPTYPQQFPISLSMPQTIQTNTAPTGQLTRPALKWRVEKKCMHNIMVAVVAVLILATAGVLLWYFLSRACYFQADCGDGSCVKTIQWCDGVKNCANAQDEAHCLRLYGPKYILQTYSPQSRSWNMVCSDRWNDVFGKAACRQIGYDSGSYVRSGKTTVGNNTLVATLNESTHVSVKNPLQKILVMSNSCLDDSVVTLQCIRCGRRITYSSRVVGGQKATMGAWPWQVSLHLFNLHWCGGSIITPYWIVSAAHCFERYSQPYMWTVYAGYLSRKQMQSRTGSRVSLIISHADFNKVKFNNDIALIKLKQPLRMSDVVGPVCLPNAGLSFQAPKECWITGWGSTVDDGPGSEFLLEAQIKLIGRATCNRWDVYNGVITDEMICAGNLQGRVDTCKGDSGGPLVTEEASLWWLVGVTSWGQSCALRNKPGVYENVTVFLKWIYEQMQKYN